MNEPEGGEEFVLVNAGWFQLEAGDHAGQQLASRSAALGDQQIEVSCLLRARDALRAVEVFAQTLDPDPSLDHPRALPHASRGAYRPGDLALQFASGDSADPV
jgi:hypothetical protein